MAQRAEFDIEAMVEQDPSRPGVERGRLVEYGVPVWGIVAHLQALTGADLGNEVDPAVAQTAGDYHVPDEGMLAAIAYYRRHRVAIDALLARNATAVA